MRTYDFLQAIPVWLGDVQRKNTTEGFYVDLDFRGQDVSLHLTASTFYRLFINGQFVYAGPARCAIGFFRVDELPLSAHLQRGKNRIAIEVTCYHATSYSYPRQDGFLQAELLADGVVRAATGVDDMPFYALMLPQRIQKVPRYSYQRTFTEAYVLSPRTNDWRTDFCVRGTLPDRVSGGVTMQRGLPLHTFSTTEALFYAQGRITPSEKADKPHPRHLVEEVDPSLDHFPVTELQVPLHREMLRFDFIPTDTVPDKQTVRIEAQSYVDATLGTIHSGFFVLHLTADAPTDVYLLFSELLDENGQINPCRTGECLDCIKLTLTEAGHYQFRSAEPYTCMPIRLLSTAAAITVERLGIQSYGYPAAMGDPVKPQNEKQACIYAAAKHTFAQSAPDLFLDCPSREYAPWLCDSFFEARVEWTLNPEMPVNRNFLENFALPAHFAYLPEGMLPMCYPADHPNGVHIPQWAMWFFLQLSDYAKHGGDAELIASLQARYFALYAYLCRYENELGLLESLPSWNFVEWSFANELVDGLNYPTNMLYVAFLQAGAQLFGDSALSEKASAVAAAVRARAFDGTYFRDHDVRGVDGSLERRPDRTETCQYYAFYFGIATPQSHPTLWEKLLCVFGPKRDANTVEPEIHPSNAFMGNYMRLELLRRYGMRDRMLAELEDYFYGMTQKTGTLWENMYTAHSCCHGFASYAIYLMQKE